MHGAGELADHVLAVHGQSDQQRLLKPAQQRHALDRYAGEPVLECAKDCGAPGQRRQYPITDGIPVLLVDESREVDEAEHAELLAKAGAGETSSPE